MKKILLLIQAALGKLERISERKRTLEAEQRELPAKIETLTAAVAGGDANSVAPLTIAKARSSVLPQDFIATQTDQDGVIGELRDLMLQIPNELREAYKAECQRVENLAKEFLESHLDNGFLIGEITRQIVANSTKVRSLEMLNSVFSGPSIHVPNPAQVVAKAKYAAENLAKV